MPVSEPAEVVVEDPDRAVGQPPRSPGADDNGPHPSNPNGGISPAVGISIVVCSRDRAEMLRAALDAVHAAMRPQDELVVVDSASVDTAVSVIAAESGARVVRADRPGLGHARNLGWRAASKPVVAFTDDDCAPAPDWTAQVAAVFTDPAVGIAFGQVVGEGEGEALSTKVSDQRRRVDPGGSVDGLGHGANLSARRSALEAVGGFDNELGAGSRFPAAEDSDLAYRLVRAGWSAVFEPSSVVSHRKWRGRAPALRVMYRYGVGAGAAAAKAGRLGDDSHRLRREVWDEGVRMAGRHLRNRYEFGVAACLARAVGATVGAARARRLRVDDTGRYVA